MGKFNCLLCVHRPDKFDTFEISACHRFYGKRPAKHNDIGLGFVDWQIGFDILLAKFVEQQRNEIFSLTEPTSIPTLPARELSSSAR